MICITIYSMQKGKICWKYDSRHSTVVVTNKKKMENIKLKKNKNNLSWEKADDDEDDDSDDDDEQWRLWPQKERCLRTFQVFMDSPPKSMSPISGRENKYLDCNTSKQETKSEIKKQINSWQLSPCNDIFLYWQIAAWRRPMKRPNFLNSTTVF